MQCYVRTFAHRIACPVLNLGLLNKGHRIVVVFLNEGSDAFNALLNKVVLYLVNQYCRNAAPPILGMNRQPVEVAPPTVKATKKGYR